MRAKRSLVAYVLLLAFAATTISACTATQRESTLKAALTTTDAANQTFLAVVQAEEAKIVAKSTSLEDYKTTVAAFRAKEAKVVVAFVVTYRAIAVAVTLNDEPSLTGVTHAVAQMLEAIAALTGGVK